MCGSFWNESDFDMKVKPQRLRNKMKYLKLIDKFDARKPEGASGLNQKQRRRAKWLKKRLGTFVEIICKHCKHKSSIKLNKPLLKRKQEKQEVKNSKIEKTALCAEEKKAHKNKKPKDKNAGLKIPELTKPETLVKTNIKTTLEDTLRDNKKKTTIVNNNLSKSTNNTLKTSNNSTKSTTNTLKITNKQAPKSIKQAPKNTNKLQVNAKIKQSNIKTFLNNIKNSSKKAVPTNKTNTISKTQQKNSILQLATLLKKKTTNFIQGLDQNRLNALVK